MYAHIPFIYAFIIVNHCVIWQRFINRQLLWGPVLYAHVNAKNDLAPLDGAAIIELIIPANAVLNFCLNL